MYCRCSVLSMLLGTRSYAWNQHVLIGRSRAVPLLCQNPSESLCSLLPARILMVWYQTTGKKRKRKERQQMDRTTSAKNGQILNSSNELCPANYFSQGSYKAFFLPESRCAAVALIIPLYSREHCEIRDVRCNPHTSVAISGPVALFNQC